MTRSIQAAVAAVRALPGSLTRTPRLLRRTARPGTDGCPTPGRCNGCWRKRRGGSFSFRRRQRQRLMQKMKWRKWWKWWKWWKWLGYGSIPLHTIFRGMNIHLPAILMFTRGIGFWPIPTWWRLEFFWDSWGDLDGGLFSDFCIASWGQMIPNTKKIRGFKVPSQLSWWVGLVVFITLPTWNFAMRLLIFLNGKTENHSSSLILIMKYPHCI